MNPDSITDTSKPICSDPTLGRWIDDFNVPYLLFVLALDDADFVEIVPNSSYNKQQRSDLLAVIRDHLAVCQHCSLKRDYDSGVDALVNQALRDGTHIAHKRRSAVEAKPPILKDPYSPHLFLCHSSADKKFVEKLALNLTELGVRVWFDKWELKAGDSIHGCIDVALDVALSSSAFVGVVISPDSMKSRWCKEELNAALAREIRSGSKVVLPLLYRSVPLPTFLVDRLYLDFRRRRLPALAELAGFIHDLDKRELSTLISQTRLRSFEDVKSLLLRLGWQNTGHIFVPRKQYETILKYLRQAGLEVACDEFELIQRRAAYRLRTTVMA